MKNGDSLPTGTDTSIETPNDEAIDNDALGTQTTTTLWSRPFKKRDLPISPFMDEAWLAARNKHRAPKAVRSKEPTPLQRKLLRNPYAQALATPVRTCAITNIRLPAYFLQDFELISHPQTNETFYLPRSLTSKFQLPREDSTFQNVEAEMESSFIPEIDNSANSSTSAGAIDVSTLPTHSSSLGPKAYVLSRYRLLALLVDKTSKFLGAWTRSFPTRRMKATRNFKQKDLRWRDDSADFVLELMRKRTMEDLRYIGKLRKGYLVQCKGFEDVEKKKGIGAVLWLPKIENSGAGKGPGEFATMDVAQKKFAVHNLEVLLGKENCDEIRKDMEVFGDEVVVVKRKHIPNRLSLRLWSLQGYLAKYNGFTEVTPYYGEISDYIEDPEDGLEDRW